MRLQRFIGAVLSLTLILALAGGSFSVASGEVREVKITYGDNTLTYNQVAARAFKEYVEKASQGKMKVTISTAIGNTQSMQEQTMQGVIEISSSHTEGTIAMIYPPIQAMAIPYLFESVDHALVTFDGEFGKKMFEDLRQETGLRVLGFWDNGGLRCFTNKVRPIRTPNDMKGLKIRTMNIPAHMELVKALGASPTPIDWNELYTAVQSSPQA